MKIGIYGGAFDPIHIEHKRIIEQSYVELGLDKMILLPSYSPPHKKNKFSPFPIRVKMIQAETFGLDYVVIDQREYNQNDYNCAYQMVAQLVKEYGNDELIYIIGGDSMVKFHTWVHPEIIAASLPIAVVARQGYQGEIRAVKYAQKNYGANIKLLSFKGKEISSSIIRATYEFGDISENVSKAVSQIIIEKKLYRYFEYYISKLQLNVSKELFKHCKSTVLYALKLADRLDLDYEEVFLAALLHDCAKERNNNDKRFKEYPQKIVHQFYGAEIAQKEYGITNSNILEAIKFHTTGKRDMTLLGRLIFCADMLEPNRQFDNVEYLRKIIEEDFEEGFKACVRVSIDKIKAAQRTVFYLTQECYDYYNK